MRRLALSMMALLLTCHAGAARSAGSVAFRRLSIPDDVPAHMATAITQDRDGFLWIGTQAGLVRYDGYDFRTFRHDPADTSTLSAAYVRTLFVSRDGRIWAGTFSGGVSVFDPATGAFRRYDTASGLAHDRVEGIAEDASGAMWIASDGGLDRLNRDGSVTPFRHDARNPRSLADDRARGLIVDSRGALWVGTRDGLQRWAGETGGFERVASQPGVKDSLAGQFVNRLFEDSRGRLWIATTDHGAAVLDTRTGTLRRIRPKSGDSAPSEGLSHYWVYAFAEVSPDEMWLATFGGGIDVVDPESLQVVDRLRHDPSIENTIGGDRVSALYRDSAGVVWAGTWGQGVARHDRSTRAFRAIRHSPLDSEGLSHPAAVRAREMSDGTIWVGTNGNGIDIFDRDLRRIGEHRPQSGVAGRLTDGAITCLAESSDGTIWVATLNGDLHRLQPKETRFVRIGRENGLPSGPVRAMAFAPDGALWAGSATGLARVEPRTLKVTSWAHRPGDASSLSGNAVEAIEPAPDGRLWIGTDNGLNLFDPATGKVTRVRAAGGGAAFPGKWIPDLMTDSKGRLWIATDAGAAILESVDGDRARFITITERTRRSTGAVEALVEDARGHVWLGPRMRVDPATWKLEEFGAAEGRQLRTYFIASRARTRDGRLLFGSPEGLLVAEPSAIQEWRYAPAVVISGVAVEGAERPDATRLRTLVLQPGERSIRVNFAATDYTAPERIRYRYRLEGLDERWTTADASQRAAVFTSLRPGSYTLRVAATNRAGRWSPREAALQVTVVPAFWETTVFRAFLGAALLAAIYGLFLLRVRRLRARSAELERLVAQRTSQLAEKHRELESAYVQIEQASLTDPLTGLRNRRFLEQTIESDLEIATRGSSDDDSRSDLLFFLLDLDHFKQVNDTWGHAAGDAVLQQLAGVLRQTFRSADHIVRWGGEEFLVVARMVPRSEAAHLAEKLRRAVEEHEFHLPDGTVIHKTCSIGFAAFPFSPEHPRAVSWNNVVDIADSALYAAKRGGRNRWIGYEDSGASAPASAADALRKDAADAVARGQARMSSAGAVGVTTVGVSGE